MKKISILEQRRSLAIIAAVITVSSLTSGLNNLPIPEAEAAKVRNCSTDEAPKGVDVSGSYVWQAIDGGSIKRFSTSSCTVTTYTSGITGDPHFITAPSTTKITFTEHIANKIGVLNADTNTGNECTNASINSPDDIYFSDVTTRYFTSIDNGKLGKITLDASNNCTFTFFNVPGTTPAPEGLDRSTDANGFFLVDQFNNKLWKFDIGASPGNEWTQCPTTTLPSKPWFVDADDTNDRVWVTFTDGRVRAYGTITCALIETSPSAGNNLYDIALMNAAPVVTRIFDPIVSKYNMSTDQWSNDDWTSECSGCIGHGIDASGTNYFASMRSFGITSKLVVGS
ncbi:MAG: hypothetical protein HMLIMOIP_002537 [Candidatus Nitrosomirales archaeon]|jgi:hypothetical protein